MHRTCAPCPHDTQHGLSRYTGGAYQPKVLSIFGGQFSLPIFFQFSHLLMQITISPRFRLLPGMVFGLVLAPFFPQNAYHKVGAPKKPWVHCINGIHSAPTKATFATSRPCLATQREHPIPRGRRASYDHTAWLPKKLSDCRKITLRGRAPAAKFLEPTRPRSGYPNLPIIEGRRVCFFKAFSVSITWVPKAIFANTQGGGSERQERDEDQT